LEATAFLVIRIRAGTNVSLEAVARVGSCSGAIACIAVALSLATLLEAVAAAAYDAGAASPELQWLVGDGGTGTVILSLPIRK
jgi:hypothetical protein